MASERPVVQEQWIQHPCNLLVREELLVWYRIRRRVEVFEKVQYGVSGTQWEGKDGSEPMGLKGACKFGGGGHEVGNSCAGGSVISLGCMS